MFVGGLLDACPLVFYSIKLFAALYSVHGPGNRLNLGLFIFRSFRSSYKIL
jgi:hypothetical protein